MGQGMRRLEAEGTRRLEDQATRRLEALLFDFDHTLADFGRWVDWKAVRADVASLYASAGTDAEAIIRRTGAFAIIAALDEDVARRHSRARADELRAEAFAIIEGHECTGAARTSLLPGAAAAVAAAERAGLGLAIVSANAARAIRIALERLGLAERFAAIIGRTASLALKPAPDMYQEALRILGTAPAAALAVGDSPNDMRGAGAAGILSIGVSGGEGRPEELFESGACYVLADLTALPTLLALWARAAER